MVFRSENENLAVKYSRQNTSVCIAQVASHAPTKDEDSSAPDFWLAQHVPVSVSPTSAQRSICYLMRSFIYACPEDIFKGHLDFLPGLYANGTDCLDHAILSAAYLVTYHRWRSSSLLTEARRSYGAAMESLRTALCMPRASGCNRIFATTLVLALYTVGAFRVRIVGIKLTANLPH
jgi:hypothetical protein